jgi:hypothetical protein
MVDLEPKVGPEVDLAEPEVRKERMVKMVELEVLLEQLE